jgi:hypothetical protein
VGSAERNLGGRYVLGDAGQNLALRVGIRNPLYGLSRNVNGDGLQDIVVRNTVNPDSNSLRLMTEVVDWDRGNRLSRTRYGYGIVFDWALFGTTVANVYPKSMLW